jgi:hypothetical protein
LPGVLDPSYDRDVDSSEVETRMKNFRAKNSNLLHSEGGTELCGGRQKLEIIFENGRYGEDTGNILLIRGGIAVETFGKLWSYGVRLYREGF